jgi:ubiquinone/menaquinone biosynthesis C-methylase UbiE
MNNFINPEKLLVATGLGTGMTFADFGAGSGSYALAAARLVGTNGMVYALDIRQESVSHIASAARLQRLNNVRTEQCDLDSMAACSVPDLTAHLVVVSKILSQLKHPERLVKQAYRVLKTGGRVLVVEWKKQPTPLGPPQETRIDEKTATDLFSKQAFKFLGNVETDAYHYGLLFEK